MLALAPILHVSAFRSTVMQKAACSHALSCLQQRCMQLRIENLDYVMYMAYPVAHAVQELER